MSFSTTAKAELIRQPLEKKCCMIAEISALTQTCGSLGFQGAGKMSVTYRMENAALARRVFTCLKKCLDVAPQLHFVQSARLGGRTSCVLTLEDQDAQTLLIALHMMERDEETGAAVLRHTSPRIQLTRQCCRRAFLRGAFLGAGSITSPEKGYHFEVVADDAGLCQTLVKTLEKSGLPAGTYERKGRSVVYLKGAQPIADALALMGASQAVMELENIRITKQLRGNINRASNCDDHNYNRTVDAAESQVEAIKLISIQRGLSSLPRGLREMAYLRLEHPATSLTELGQMLDPPIGKSGVNHRMLRLTHLAQEIEQELRMKGEENHD